MALLMRHGPIRRGRIPTPGGGIYATSATQAAVADAVAAANEGDTIHIPAGVETWPAGVGIYTPNISLIGAGESATVLTRANAAAFGIHADGVRISQMGFPGGTYISVVSGSGWRVHHCAFPHAAFSYALYVRGASKTVMPCGLFDNCHCTNTQVLVHAYPAVSIPELVGSTLWSAALPLGGAGSVYVEDNTFTFTVFGNAVDANYSGRYVFRYNEVSGTYLEAHSTYASSRGTRCWEIYGNTIDRGAYAVYRPFLLRGGTGVVYDNTITGAFGDSKIAIDNRRSYEGGGAFGTCDGTSIYDGNEEAGGYWARDQIGRAFDASAWPPAAPYPAQALNPAYFWNNGQIVYVANGCGNHIHPNRDYYDYVPSGFDGSVGCGRGLLAARPATCTVGVGYFATDTGKLYTATATDTWAEYYTPYTYPHPLQATD